MQLDYKACRLLYLLQSLSEVARSTWCDFNVYVICDFNSVYADKNAATPDIDVAWKTEQFDRDIQKKSYDFVISQISKRSYIDGP